VRRWTGQPVVTGWVRHPGTFPKLGPNRGPMAVAAFQVGATRPSED
jgi:hypothetical protein